MIWGGAAQDGGWRGVQKVVFAGVKMAALTNEQVRGAECVVMAGDPKQLPPTLHSDGALDAQLDRTLFDRLQDSGVCICTPRWSSCHASSESGGGQAADVNSPFLMSSKHLGIICAYKQVHV